MLYSLCKSSEKSALFRQQMMLRFCLVILAFSVKVLMTEIAVQKHIDVRINHTHKNVMVENTGNFRKTFNALEHWVMLLVPSAVHYLLNYELDTKITSQI